MPKPKIGGSVKRIFSSIPIGGIFKIDGSKELYIRTVRRNGGNAENNKTEEAIDIPLDSTVNFYPKAVDETAEKVFVDDSKFTPDFRSDGKLW